MFYLWVIEERKGAGAYRLWAGSIVHFENAWYDHCKMWKDYPWSQDDQDRLAEIFGPIVS